MKPAPFSCLVPETEDELLATLAAEGDAVRLLAGGQSLVPMMNLRLVRAEALVDLNRIETLGGIRAAGQALELGAMLRQADLFRAPEIAQSAPLLVQAAAHTGYPATRGRGTVGGSAAHADPAAELPAALLALDATMVLRSAQGEREIPADDFFVDTFTTTCAADEALVALRIPAAPAGARSVFLEVARRRQDFPLCGVAAWMQCEAGRCVDLRVALCSAAPRPVRARGVEAALRGESLEGAALADAAARVDADIDPLGDLHGSEAYRRDLARTLTRRALEALAREESAHA